MFDRAHQYSKLVIRLTNGNIVDAVDFYCKIFGAKLLYIYNATGENSRAEIRVKNTLIHIYACDAQHKYPDIKNLNYISVYDASGSIQTATQLGARLLYGSIQKYCGLASNAFTDPFGITWVVTRACKHVRGLKTLKTHINAKRHHIKFNKKFHKLLHNQN